MKVVRKMYNMVIKVVRKRCLNVYREKFCPAYSIRISSKNFGYSEDRKLKSIPLYAVFCIKE